MTFENISGIIIKDKSLINIMKISIKTLLTDKKYRRNTTNIENGLLTNDAWNAYYDAFNRYFSDHFYYTTPPGGISTIPEDEYETIMVEI